MQFRNIFLVAVVSAAVAARQRVIVRPASAADTITPGLDIANSTETITSAPPPLETGVPQRPTLGASMMGLIVFSAAGLVLL